MICFEREGWYPRSKIKCLDNNLADNDICYDGNRPNINGIKNLGNKIWHYNVLDNLPTAQNVIQPRKISNYCKIAGVKIFERYENLFFNNISTFF